MCFKTFFFYKTQGLTFLSRYLHGTLIYNLKILSVQFIPGPQNSYQKSDLLYGDFIYLTKLNVFTFLSYNLYGRYPLDVNFQNSEYFFWFLHPNIFTKSAIRFVLRGNLLNKTQGFAFLRWNLYGRYP
jgi:hypothetical protein